MATRRITAEERAQASETEPEYVEYSADLNYDADTEEALHKLRDTFAGTDTKGTMWVYRLPLDDRGEVVGNAKPSMCFNAPLDRYELEELSSKLAQEYMKGGERAIFRVTATVRGQQGMKLNRLLILQRENDAPVEPSGGRESFADLLRLMQESNTAAADRTERLLTALAARQSTTPPVDPVEQSMRMMAAMTGLTSSLVMRTQGVTAADPMASLTSTMAVLKQMRGFFGDAGGGDEGDPDSVASIFRAAAPIASTIGELLKRAPPQPMLAGPNVRRRRAGVPVSAATPSGAPAAPRAPDPIIQGIRQMLAQIRPQVDAMITSAADGADPKAVAQLLLEAFEPDSMEEKRFMGFLERSDWWQLLSGVHPGVVPHQAWFTNLRAAVLAAFESDEPEEPAPGA